MLKKLRLMVVAGESSGDAHAAALVNALRTVAPDVQFEFFGATGTQLRNAGVDTVVATDQLSIVGLLEIGRALPKFLQVYKDLKRAAVEREADAVILVDWPDFNLRLARALHRRGIKVIYYISPQLWAWRAHRVESIKRNVDLLLTILPFEEEWYRGRGMENVRFVGHPLVGVVKARYDRAQFCRLHDLNSSRPIISLLPGSRHKELVRITPVLLDAAVLLQRTRNDLQFVLVVAPNRLPAEVKEIIAARKEGLPGTFRIVHHETREALAASDAAAVASGTATLEAALLATPLVIVYKESDLNYKLLSGLIDTDHYGLVNLIAERRLATELIQYDFTAERVAKELLQLLEPGKNKEMRSELEKATAGLGEGGASQRAAQAVLEYLNI